MTTRRRTYALFLVALFFSVGLSPAASAWHNVPDPGEPFEEPPVSIGGEKVETGIIPVDRELERVPETVDTANDTVTTNYQVIGDGIDAVESILHGIAEVPITLMEDGAGGRAAADPLDRLEGGFSDPVFIGTHAWEHTQDAAYRGQEGYSTPRDPRLTDGRYLGHAETLLVTPELDLRTQTFQDTRMQALVNQLAGQAGFAGLVDTSRWDTWHKLYWTCDAVAHGSVFIGAHEDLAPMCLALREAMEQQEALATFEYRMRHNLGLGRDGVATMVFTEEPSVEVAQQCTPPPPRNASLPTGGNDFVFAYAGTHGWTYIADQVPPACRIVLPEGGYPSDAVDKIPGGRAYSGYSDWTEDVIDLTPWEGEDSVWIGFYFASEAILQSTYFEAEGPFPNQDAGFYGFQADDLAVKSTAAPVNPVVRPLVEPTRPVIQGVPTLHPDLDVPLLAHVANLGTRPVDVKITARILEWNVDGTDRDVAASAPDIFETIPAGEYMDLEHTFASGTLDTGRYVAQVCVVRTGVTLTEDEGAFCDTPPDRGACSGDDVVADPCAQVSETVDFFEVRPVQGIQPGIMGMGQDTLLVGDTTSVSLPVRNDGNRPETVQVQAYHVNLAGNALGQELLDPLEPGVIDPMTVTIAPDAVETLTWTVTGGQQDVGQYRFVALINSTAERQPDFDADHHLLPKVTQPWHSRVVDGSSIVLDGSLGDSGWVELPDQPLAVDGVRAQVANNGTHLLLGLKNVPSDGIAVFLNDGGDTDMDSGSGGLGVLVEGGQAAGFRHGGDDWELAPPRGSTFQVAAGGSHSLSITGDGTVNAWGRGAEGQLGSDGTADQATPTPVVAGEQPGSGFLQDITFVSGGGAHSLAVAGDGSVYAWGRGVDGQLGNDNGVDQSSPVRVANGTQESSSGFLANATSVAAGFNHSLALLDDGTVVAWGSTADGRLGHDFNASQEENETDEGGIPIGEDGVPIGEVDVPDPADHYEEDLDLSDAPGGPNVCNDGPTMNGEPIFPKVGSEAGKGLIGDDPCVSGDSGSHETWADKTEEIMNSPSAGICAFILVDWPFLINVIESTIGCEPSIELGEGEPVPVAETSRPTPVHVDAGEQGTDSERLENVTAVAAGRAHSLALLENGTVYAWGNGTHGQLGNGATADQETPVQVAGLQDVVAIAAGDSHSLALTQGGLVYAWGNGSNGRLGNDATADQLTPVQVSGLQDATAIAAGASHSLALLDNGTLVAWGSDADGRLGNGKDAGSDQPVPVPVVGIQGVAGVAAGGAHSLAFTGDDIIHAWGKGENGRLGIDTGSDSPQVPVRVHAGEQEASSSGFLENVIMVASGTDHSLALTDDGSVYAWGAGSSGRLGNGQSLDQLAPVRVLAGEQEASTSGFLEDVVSISAGGANSLAVTAGGAVYTWGNGADGRLGNGVTTSNSASPVRVHAGEQEASSSGFLENVVNASVGNRHTLALLDDGTVYAWGDGEERIAFTKFKGGPSEVSFNDVHCGWIGDGKETFASSGRPQCEPVGPRSEPVQVLVLQDAVSVVASDFHSLAVTEDGTLYGWGFRADCRLSLGCSVSNPGPRYQQDVASPVALRSGIQDAASISVHTLALRDDGAVRMWKGDAGSPVLLGRSSGHLGFTSGTGSGYVHRLTDAVEVAAGDRHSLAITEDGSVWAWGFNPDAQLGIGPHPTHDVPVKVWGGEQAGSGFFRDAVNIAAGDSHSLAATGEGSVYSWGLSDNGRLGTGQSYGGVPPDQDAPARTAAATFETWGIQGHGSGTEYELAIPIDGPTGASVPWITAGPGDDVGIAIRFCADFESGSPCNSYPVSVPVHDGAGFQDVPGMADELQHWHTVRLGDPAKAVPAGEATPYAEVVVGPGFGVGTKAPPYFMEDFSDCSSVQEWETLRYDPIAGIQDKWNCNFYPDDGRNLMFKGVVPGSDCGADQCLPYAGLSGAPYFPMMDRLWTPPIEIPASAKEPNVVLAHQYSTDLGLGDGWNGLTNQAQSLMRVGHDLHVALEVWDVEAGEWVDGGMLEPDAGYSTDASAGVWNPDISPRDFDTTPSPPPQWWRPQGYQSVLSPGDMFPRLTSLEGGSPWVTDTIPLHGTHFKEDPFGTDPPTGLEKTLDLGGETVRLRFVMDTDALARRPDLDTDWGWRVGGLAVVEGATFTDDVTVESAVLDVIYDPSERGVGPGTTLPVQVTVRNDGLRDASNIAVRVVGTDLVAGDGEDPFLCDATKAVPATVLAGTTGQVTVDCDLADRPGALLALTASVQMPGDDFTGGDQQRVRGQFPLTASPDAAVSVDAPTDGPAGVARDIQIGVQNLGNVPVEDATISLEVFDISEGLSSPAIQPLEWTTVQPLEIQTEPVRLKQLMTTEDATFTPPSFTPEDSGTYLVVVRLDIPGADPTSLSQASDILLMQASEDIYRNDLGPGEPSFQDLGVMDGGLAIVPDGNGTSPWSMQSDGAGNVYLHAGDPERGELPPDTDAIVDLPSVDLSALRSAALTFKHRYDLEEGFDAGRVEISTDGGKTWQPMTPRPQSLDGLPDGHPSTRLVGANVLLDEEVECFACAFTGRSDGWEDVQYDLGLQEEFFREGAIDPWPLDGLESHAEPETVVEGTPQTFANPDWRLGEENAGQTGRQWWIDATYNRADDDGTDKTGGWHIDTVDGPPWIQRPVTAWRFHEDNNNPNKAYPVGADSRLVSPVLDLRGYAGDEVRLAFDHKYRFDGDHDSISTHGNYHLARARDGGVVSYQVFDHDTGTFGPWQVLGARSDPPNLATVGGTVMVEGDGGRFAMGYPARFPGATTTPESPTLLSEIGGGVDTFNLGIRPEYRMGSTFAPSTIRYAFTGDSAYLHPDNDGGWKVCDSNQGEATGCRMKNEESAGWDHVEWDVSHLIGEEVRLAFHAWTRDTESWSCREDHGCPLVPEPPGQFDDTGPDKAEGWTVANVEVQGKQYQGGPAQMRFRLATDGSMPKGEWSIDDIRIVGQRYQEAVVIRSDEPKTLGVPGDRVTLEGEVRNVGTASGDDLALAIEASYIGIDETGQVALLHTPFDLLDPKLEPATGDLPSGVPDDAWGPLDLPSGTSLPLRLDVRLPDRDADVQVRIVVLECVADDPQTGGCMEYQAKRNERSAGEASADWQAVATQATDLDLVPPLPGRPGDMVTSDPAVPTKDQTITLRASFKNVGTTTPDDVEATWTVHEVLRKGCTSQQHQTDTCDRPYTNELLGREWALGSTSGLRPEPGQVIPLATQFAPPEDGIYRAVLDIRDGDGSTLYNQTSFEFIVGDVEPYYLIDFAQTGAEEDDWNLLDDAAVTPSGSPPEINFRHVEDEGALVWGVTAAERAQDGLHYCRIEQGPTTCNSVGKRDDPPPPPAYGLHGSAETPVVDLGHVIGEDAVLSLRHGHGFTDGDGAVVEALPLRSPATGTPRAAFECVADDGSRADAWFRLTPTNPEDLRGETRYYSQKEFSLGGRPPVPYYFPERLNPVGPLGPLHDLPVIGGDGVDEEVLRFPLGAQDLQPVCPVDDDLDYSLDGEPPASLVGYDLRARLRVGTTPGIVESDNCEHDSAPPGVCPDSPREGDLGWHIRSLGVSSVDVEIRPDSREVPIQDGYPKRFNVQVHNNGPLEETVLIALSQDGNTFSADPDWFTFPEPVVTLLPGESRIVPVEVDIPTDSDVQRGRHTAIVRATSTLDPNIHDDSLLALRLEENLLPELDVTINNIEAETPGEPPEVGEPTQVFVRVENIGRSAADPVPVRVDAVRIDEDGAERRSLVQEYGLPELGAGDDHITPIEWIPHAPGQYRIEVVADPDGRLIQKSTENSARTAMIDVLPLQRSDIRLTALGIDGVSEDGYALEGDLVTIRANVTNAGSVTAAARVVILAGGAQLLEKDTGPIAQGHHREVTAFRIASSGDTTIRAVAIPTDGGDHHEMSRVLRVRALDLSYGLTDTGPMELVPGGTASTRVDLNNTGNAVERVTFSLDPAHAGWGLAATPAPVTVAPHADAWSILTVQAPDEALAGDYDLDVIATPQSRPGSGTVVQIPVRVSERLGTPDLVVEDTTAAPGAANVTVQLTSHGNSRQDVTLTLLEPDWTSTPADATLAAGETARAEIPLTVPPHTPPGPVPVRVEARDGDGAPLTQAHGTINVTTHASGTAQWSDRTDILLENLTRRTFQVTLNVTNTGNVPFDTETTLTGLSDGAEAPTPPSVQVDPGEMSAVPVTVHVTPESSGRVDGRVDVHMRLSGGHAANAANASTLVPFATLDLPDLGALPDLAITEVAVRPRGAVSAGEPVRMEVTVENLGIGDAPATELFVYVDGEAVGIQPISALAPGNKTIVQVNGTFPASGEYLVHLIADGPDHVTELHGDNNGWTRQATVEDGDLFQQAKEAPMPPWSFVLVLLLAACMWTRRRHA